jgi:6-phosphogluconolactonase (cycloisomerase 2 family)
MRIANRHLALRSSGFLAVALALALAAPGMALLPEPDHIFYGTPTLDGQPAPSGVVSVRRADDATVLASYVIGSDPAVGERYVLRVPIDSVDPRTPGTARTGDPVEFFIDGVPAGSGVVGERGTVQLYNVDPAGGGLPTLSITDIAIYEGNAGNTAFAFTVTLSEAIEENVTFQWKTTVGTAQGGIDFIEVPAGTPGQVNAGDTTTTLTVQVKGDTFEEDNDTFFVNLSNVSANAVIFDPQAVGTILDDDRPPAISIADVSIAEGDSGTTPVQLSLSLTRPVPQIITVSWATAPGTASAGSDYQTASGFATFAANTTATTIGVNVFGDLVDEDDETFVVNLSAPSSPGVIADGQATVRILDDDGFLTFIEAESLAGIDTPTLVENLFGVTGIAVSPDGAHVYAVGQFDDAIAGFTRNSLDGSLTFLFSLSDGEIQGLDTIDGLDGAESVAISPDGAHVYVASFTDSAVAMFARDANPASPTYGTLDFVTVYKDSSLGGAVASLLGASSITLSADGGHLYVAATTDDAVTVFGRDTAAASPTYGELTAAGGPVDGVGGVDGLDGAQWVRVTPDGAHVYVASGVDKAIAVFAREGSTGALTWVQAVKDGVGGANGLDGASSVAISIDGSSVYATGPNEDAVAVYDRNDATGILTFVEMEVDGTAGVDGLDGATGVVVSFDGRYVYVNGYLDDSVAVFSRDTTNGQISYMEREKNNFGTVVGLARPVEIALSGDDQHLYVAGNNEDAVVVFMRDAIAPSLPLSLTSTSHTVNVFSSDPTVDMLWSGAADNPGGSGLAGYSFLFNASLPLTVPDQTIDLLHTVDPHGTTSAPLPDGTDYWFHFRVCDLVGNCSGPVHLGPYKIDATAPSNPAAIVSTSHTVGVPDADTAITMTWTPATDALSGVDGYSVAFDASPSTACDQIKDLEEGATTTTSAVLPDGSWYFHLCTRDNAGNWSAAVHRGPYVVEASAPEAVAVWTVADTNDGLLTPGEAVNIPITQLLVAFDEPLSDPAGNGGVTDASNPANYPILKPGGNGTFETTTCGPLVGDDQQLLAASATYDAASSTTVLRLGTQTALPAGAYRLLVCGSVTAGANSIVDLYGHPLDGDGNGTGGDPHVLAFSVEATDLLKNPNFDADVAFWTPVPATPGIVRHDAEDADLAPTSGSVIAEYVGGSQFYAVSQCVAVTAEAEYVAGGSARLDSGLGGAPSAYAQVRFYQSGNCTVQPLGTELFSSQVIGDTAGGWEQFSSGTLVAPASASSAYVSFVIDSGSAPDFDGYFDRLYFQAPTWIFASGFESGTFSEWNLTVP